MPRVLVTGANGHVGAHTVRSLLSRGHGVIAMVREGADLRGLQGLDVEYRYADVLDEESVRSAIHDCDTVIHSAAVYAVWAKDSDEIVGPSVTGTRNVYAAAKAAGVRRMIYTSSIVAIGLSESPDVLCDASNWNEDAENPYFMAKVRGEQEAIRLSQEYDIDTVRLCPAMVLGPLDYKITPSTKMVQDLINGSGVSYTGGINLVHVRDVGEVHALAVELGLPGARYIIGGENLQVTQLADLVEKWSGIRPRHMGVNRGMALAFGSLMDGFSKITGKPPQFSRSMAHEQSHRWQFYDCDETYRVFGYTPTSADESVRDTVRWLLFTGKIRRELADDLVANLAPDPEWVV